MLLGSVIMLTVSSFTSAPIIGAPKLIFWEESFSTRTVLRDSNEVTSGFTRLLII